MSKWHADDMVRVSFPQRRGILAVPELDSRSLAMLTDAPVTETDVLNFLERCPETNDLPDWGQAIFGHPVPYPADLMASFAARLVKVKE